MNKKLHYATQLYRPPNAGDYTRLLDGLKQNLELPNLRAATIFLDNCTPPFDDPRVEWVPRQSRASFADFLKLADTTATAGRKHDSCSHLLFSNSDIVFNDSIDDLVMALSEPAWAASLTRRELDGSFPAGIEPLQSQDAWMLMRQPLSPRLIDQMEAIQLGIAGCEHLLAAALVAHGFDLWNPCEDCYARHTDLAPQQYSLGGERYWGLYAYVPPCRLEHIGQIEPRIFYSYARAPGRYHDLTLR